jgi:hypothetical protein
MLSFKRGAGFYKRRERERERENKETYLLYFLKKEGERERINRLILCVS